MSAYPITQPAIIVGKAPSNPSPAPTYGEKWVKRRYLSKEITLTTGPGDLNVTLTNGFTTNLANCVLDKLTVWKIFNTNSAVGSLQAEFQTQNVTTLGSDPIEAYDYGSVTSLPGITFKVPLGFGKMLSTTDTLVIIRGAPQSSVYAVQIDVWARI